MTFKNKYLKSTLTFHCDVYLEDLFEIRILVLS